MKSHGVGLGFVICRSIVDAHDGRIQAEPNQPRGAIFRFTLPALREGASADEMASPS
jgi:K+-sensing histidine kinase KdpD